MIDDAFRKQLPKVTDPLIRLYSRLGLTPNMLSVLGFVFAILASCSVAVGWFWLALLLWWLGRLFDGTDGIYARATQQTSEFGAFLDILLDMAAYGSMVIGFSFYYPEYSLIWTLMLFFYILCITGALGLGAIEDKLKMKNKDNRGMRLAAGLAEAGETGIAYSLFLVFPQYIGALSVVWLLVLLTTVVARLRLARTILP